MENSLSSGQVLVSPLVSVIPAFKDSISKACWKEYEKGMEMFKKSKGNQWSEACLASECRTTRPGLTFPCSRLGCGKAPLAQRPCSGTMNLTVHQGFISGWRWCDF